MQARPVVLRRPRQDLHARRVERDGDRLARERRNAIALEVDGHLFAARLARRQIP